MFANALNVFESALKASLFATTVKEAPGKGTQKLPPTQLRRRTSCIPLLLGDITQQLEQRLGRGHEIGIGALGCHRDSVDRHFEEQWLSDSGDN